MTQESQPPLEYPDARMTLSVKCENGELESGVKQLNPLLQGMIRARAAALEELGETADRQKPVGGANSHFGRLTFSQS
jgi:hypothetical protein